MAINNKKTGTQHHHKIILHLSCHIQRVLSVATKVEQGTIRVGYERLLVITGALIARTVTERATSCHHWWYMCLLHWIIHSSIHLSFPRFFKSHPALHRTLLVITDAFIESIVTQIAMGFHHRWYLWFLHWMIQSLIHLICNRFTEHNARVASFFNTWSYFTLSVKYHANAVHQEWK